MKTRTVYIARSGKEFDDKEDCERYEKVEGVIDALSLHINHNIIYEFDSDSGSDIITEGNVCNYVLNYIDEINAILRK